MQKTAREEVSSTLLGSSIMVTVTYDCITSSNCHCMPMAYFNRAACIYDMWIILLDAVIISPSIRVTAVNDSRPTTFTCLSPTGLNEGGIVSIQWLLNGMFLEDLNLNNVNSIFAGGFGTLIFSRVRLDQNSTSVSCSVHLTSGRVENSSDSLLLVQGL